MCVDLEEHALSNQKVDMASSSLRYMPGVRCTSSIMRLSHLHIRKIFDC